MVLELDQKVQSFCLSLLYIKAFPRPRFAALEDVDSDAHLWCHEKEKGEE